MITLNNLKNTHRPKKNVVRVGRGIGSGRGKTCCRGGKGDSARQGFKMREGNEGGQKPLYRKLPRRGFCNERFRDEILAINLSTIETWFESGDVVNLETLKIKGFGHRRVSGLKILGDGELKKKVIIEAHTFSKSAREKIEKNSISFKELELKVKVQGLMRIFSVSELRKKIVFTIVMLILCRIGAFIPVPGINGGMVANLFRQATGGGQNLFQLMDVFSGGAFAQMTVIALGVMPYISASIIMQLVMALVPSLQREIKENPEMGKRKMGKWIRLFTVLLAVFQSALLQDMLWA